MSTMPTRILRLIALHEACHAIVMLAEGTTLVHVTIREHEGMIGHVKPSVSTTKDPLVSIVAGEIGVEWFSPGGGELIRAFLQTYTPTTTAPPGVNHPSDGVMADAAVKLSAAKFDAGKMILPSQSEIHSTYVRAMVRALDILRRNALAVEQIREAILHRGTLSGAHAATIFRQAQEKTRRALVERALFQINNRPIDMELIGAM